MTIERVCTHTHHVLHAGVAIGMVLETPGGTFRAYLGIGHDAADVGEFRELRDAVSAVLPGSGSRGQAAEAASPSPDHGPGRVQPPDFAPGHPARHRV